jgi:hypothetical protein
VQIVPTFDYLIPYWKPILMNTCKSLEDTLRHWTYHVKQYLHYYTLHYTLTTIGPHEFHPSLRISSTLTVVCPFTSH